MTSAVGRRVPRVQDVALPLLRNALPGVQITSWVPQLGQRKYPLLNVRRLGGLPHTRSGRINLGKYDAAVVELTAFGDESLAATENLLLDANYVLWKAVDQQTTTEAGYLHSFFETMGPTEFDSPYEDTWRVQALVQLGLRPPKN